jgi:hypothetical protein
LLFIVATLLQPDDLAGGDAAGGVARLALERERSHRNYFHNCHDARPVLMIRKLQSGEYRLYSRKVNPKTGKRRNLGTFKSRAAAEKHERDVQYFKRH